VEGIRGAGWSDAKKKQLGYYLTYKTGHGEASCKQLCRTWASSTSSWNTTRRTWGSSTSGTQQGEKPKAGSYGKMLPWIGWNFLGWSWVSTHHGQQGDLPLQGS